MTEKRKLVDVVPDPGDALPAVSEIECEAPLQLPARTLGAGAASHSATTTMAVAATQLPRLRMEPLIAPAGAA